MADFIGIDGRISQRVPIVCDDGEEAKRRTKQMVDGHVDRALATSPQGRDVQTGREPSRCDPQHRQFGVP